jgi:protein O-GlcNAc transferase
MGSVEETFQKAIKAINSGRPLEAERLFKDVLKYQPKNIAALNLLTVALMSLERYEEAEKFISRAVELNQSSDVSYYNYGLISKALNKPQQALTQFDNALGLKTNVPETWNNRGTVFNDLKQYEKAISDLDRAISLAPKYSEAFYNKGKSLSQLERYDDALAAYDKALSLKPDLVDAWLGRGNVFCDLKRYDEAFAAYDKALSLKPNLENAWLGRGNVFYDLKRYDEALAAYEKVLAIKPDLAGAWLGRGNVLWDLKRYDEALAAYEKALAIRPDLENAWLGRGNVLYDLNRYDEAFAAFDKALAIKPDLAGAWLGRGNVFSDLKRYDEALAAYEKALAIKSNLEGAWLGRGNAFYGLNRHDEAFGAYDKALAIKPDLAGAWLGRGNVFSDLKRYDEAFAAYDKALAIKSNLEGTWLGRGNAFYGLNRYDEAFAAYDKALAIKPDLAGAWLGRGNVFFDLKRYDEAFAAYDKALAIEPDLVGVEGARLHSKMHLCNWDNISSDCAHLIESVINQKESADPFTFLGISSSAEEQLNCASRWVQKKYPPSRVPFWKGAIYKHNKIRIGYMSADFRQHPVAYLIAGIFECHDRAQFEITAISIGPNDGSEMRKRLEDSFDKFVDARTLSSDDIARKISEDEIDILIDLNGFTQNGRAEVFARRPSPIQVNYLGYPGTMGASYIDYIIGDPILISASQLGSYREKVVYLPHCYLPHDERGRAISDRAFERSEFGLSEQSFVFCCFNNAYKFSPKRFRLWMKLLKAVEGSVLWLSESNTTAAGNLRKEAISEGVNPERIVFASRLTSAADYLARYRLADLFLDTLPYNAHTTASDALWAGLPVITQIGSTFAGRVAASLLNAINLPELITETPEEYERRAIDLAMHPEKLAAIKHKLAENRLTSPLFDTRLFTKHIEAAYTAMHERHQTGLAPDHIVVPSDAYIRQS